jgi:hypothetical protein
VKEVYRLMQQRISLLLSLPMQARDRMSLQQRASAIAEDVR